MRDRERSIGEGERDGMVTDSASCGIDSFRMLRNDHSLVRQIPGSKIVKVDVFLQSFKLAASTQRA